MSESKTMLSRDGILGQGHPDDAFWRRFWDERGIGEWPCRRCMGTGRRTYSSTARYFGGIGGQAMTPAECDRCWGTGDDANHGADLRELHKAAQARRPRRAPSPAVKALVEAAKREHQCATLRDDGTCDGCQLSAAIAAVEMEIGERSDDASKATSTAFMSLIEEARFCASTFASMGGSGPAHAKRIEAALAAVEKEIGDHSADASKKVAGAIGSQP